MPVCKGDGSKEDGGVTGFSGLGRTTDAWNASSCSMQMHSTVQQTQEEIQLQRDIIAYLKNPQPDKRNDLLSRLVRR